MLHKIFRERMTYFLVETFALGDLSGGRWEEAIIVKGSTPEKAFAEALDIVTHEFIA